MPTSETNIDGIMIRYRDSGGAGLPVLLCGGIGSSLEFWDKQFDGLGDTQRLIAWDYPGHGLSDLGDQPYEHGKLAKFALRFLDTLGIDRAVVAGNSLGGAIAIHMAGLAPQRVAGLVLISPAMTGKEVFAPFKLMALPGLGEAMTKPSEKGIGMQTGAIFHPSYEVTPEFTEIVRRNLYKPGGDKAFLATMRLTLNLFGIRKAVWQKSRELLAATKCPVVFVHGRDDKVLPFKQSVECDALTPNSRLELLDQCGHTAQIEKPEEVNRLLSTFVSGLEEPAA